MHKLVLLVPIFFLLACGGSDPEVTEVSTEDSAETSMAASVDTVLEVPEEVPRNDWGEKSLEGAVKKLSTHTFDVDDEGQEVGMGGYSESFIFDERGFILRQSNTGCCGFGFEEIKYKRKEDGTLTHRIFKVDENYDEITEETPLDHKEKYFYDEDGTLVKMKVAGADSVLTEEHMYTWNASGQLIEKKVHDMSYGEDETWSEHYTYNADGQLIQLELVSDTDESLGGREYDYDENGMVIQERITLSDGMIQTYRYTYTFDDQGNWIKRTSKYRTTLPNGEKEDWSAGQTAERTIVYF